MSRNKSFEDFDFSIDEYGYPNVLDNLADTLDLNKPKTNKWKQQKAF